MFIFIAVVIVIVVVTNAIIIYQENNLQWMHFTNAVGAKPLSEPML